MDSSEGSSSDESLSVVELTEIDKGVDRRQKDDGEEEASGDAVNVVESEDHEMDKEEETKSDETVSAKSSSSTDTADSPSDQMDSTEEEEESPPEITLTSSESTEIPAAAAATVTSSTEQSTPPPPAAAAIPTTPPEETPVTIPAASPDSTTTPPAAASDSSAESTTATAAAASSSLLSSNSVEIISSTFPAPPIVPDAAAAGPTTAQPTSSQQNGTRTTPPHHNGKRRPSSSPAEVVVMPPPEQPSSEYSDNGPLSERLIQMFETGFNSDATIVLGPPRNRTRIRVHRVIMNLGSGILPVLFTTSEFRDVVFLEDVVDPVPFREYLRLIYGDSEMRLTNPVETLRHAIRFKSPEPAKWALKQIDEDAARDAELLAQVFVLGMEYRQTGILEAEVVGVICRNASEMLSSEVFLSLPVDCIQVLISQDDLEVENEVEVFKFVMRWTQRQAEKNGESGSDRQVLRRYFEPLVHFIRFPLIDIDTLILEVVVSNILEEEELNPLLLTRCAFEKQMVENLFQEVGLRQNGATLMSLAECNQSVFSCHERKWKQRNVVGGAGCGVGQDQNRGGGDNDEPMDVEGGSGGGHQGVLVGDDDVPPNDEQLDNNNGGGEEQGNENGGERNSSGETVDNDANDDDGQ